MNANDMIKDDDPIIQAVLKNILHNQRASASDIQRKFSVGYNKAARIIDYLEEKGYIGPLEGGRPREVFYTVDMYKKQYGEDPFDLNSANDSKEQRGKDSFDENAQKKQYGEDPFDLNGSNDSREQYGKDSFDAWVNSGIKPQIEDPHYFDVDYNKAIRIAARTIDYLEKKGEIDPLDSRRLRETFYMVDMYRERYNQAVRIAVRAIDYLEEKYLCQFDNRTSSDTKPNIEDPLD